MRLSITGRSSVLGDELTPHHIKRIATDRSTCEVGCNNARIWKTWEIDVHASKHVSIVIRVSFLHDHDFVSLQC